MSKFRTPLKAIREKCLDCSCHQPREVKECPVTSCALWPYRMGRVSRIVLTGREFLYHLPC